MDYINIISQEEILQPVIWPALVVGGLAITIVIGLMIYAFITNNPDKVIEPMLLIGFSGILVMIFVYAISAIFFQVPTGRYKYEATIDKDKITVAEYEQFIEEYNPTIKDGIYYWEDKAE